MSEYTPYDEPRKKKKRVKIKPKTIFGIFCGTFILFIVAFLLSYMLMNHNLPTSGTKSLAEENKELKERIEMLEKRLEKYEDVDDSFSKQRVPDKYTGAVITPGGSEPAENDSVDEDEEETDTEQSSKSGKNKDKNDKTDKNDKESAYDGIIDNDDDIPANTGVSDAPVILN